MPRKGERKNGSPHRGVRDAVIFTGNIQNTEVLGDKTASEQSEHIIEFDAVIQNGDECETVRHVVDLDTETAVTSHIDTKSDFADVLASFDAQVTYNNWHRSRLEGEMNLAIIQGNDPVLAKTDSLDLSALNLMSDYNSRNPLFVDPSTWLNFDEHIDFIVKSPTKEKFPADDKATVDTNKLEIENTNIISASQSEHTLEFHLGNRNIMLMTPQELESMPSGGLEFEESVGPKKSADVIEFQHPQNGIIPIKTTLLSSEIQSLPIPSIKLSTLDADADTTYHILLDSSDGTQKIYAVDGSQLIAAASNNTSMQPMQINVTNIKGNATCDGKQLTAYKPGDKISNDDSNLPGNELHVVVREEKDESDKKYKCVFGGCFRSYNKKSKLLLHEMNHRGERPYKCREKGCEWAFTTAHRLKRHMDSHRKLREFVCDVQGCGNKFSTVYNLQAHKKIHGRPLNEVCHVDGCCLSFSSKRQLDQHLKTHPNAEKKYKCPHEGCEKRFHSPHSIGSHVRVHKDERVIVCDICGKKFEKPCRLRQHLRIHTGERPYKCLDPGCIGAFSTASKLKRHSYKHTQERRFPCPFVGCTKAFLRSEHLKGHMSIHTGEKPFACTIEGCDAKYSTKNALGLHLRKHEEDKIAKPVFHCPIEGCNKKYDTKLNLRSHLVQHYQTHREFAELLVPVELTESEEGLHDAVMVSEDQQIMSYQPEVITEQVGNNVVTQMIATEPIDVYVAPESSASQANNYKMLKISISKEAEEKLLHNDSCGSARTDYYGNQMLSDRAKKRKKLLRDKSGIDKPRGEHSKKKAAAATPATNNSSSISSHEMLTSRAITFRDPETGNTYLQTQLLQDDPPNPELFTDEASTPLTTELLQETPDTIQQNAEFTQTTINLQDLE